MSQKHFKDKPKKVCHYCGKLRKVHNEVRVRGHGWSLQPICRKCCTEDEE